MSLTLRSPFEKLILMKKLLLLGFLAVSFGLPASADLKIAMIDTTKTFDAFYKTNDMAKQIAVRKARYEKEIEDVQAEYKSTDQEAQALDNAVKDAMTPADVRKEKNTALAQKVQDLQGLERQIDEMRRTDSQELKDTLVRSHQEISDEMMKVITTYVSAQGYDLVLDKSAVSATGLSMFSFSSVKIIDLTSEIIVRLNAAAPVH